MGQRWWKAIVLAVTLLCGLGLTRSAAAGRKALVIGNAAYRVGDLANPVRDAELVGRALRDVGFTVSLREDLSGSEMADAVNRFARGLGSDDVVFFYYAGHGMEVSGVNLLLGVDFSAESEDDAVDRGYRLERLIERLDASGARVRIIVIDACRDDPFSRRWSRSVRGRGFAVVAREAMASGTYIAFSTAPHDVADDGRGDPNSPFTAALARHILDPATDIDVMFRRVRADVQRTTDGRQRPWTEHQLTGEYHLVPGGASPPPPPRPGRDRARLAEQAARLADEWVTAYTSRSGGICALVTRDFTSRSDWDGKRGKTIGRTKFCKDVDGLRKKNPTFVVDAETAPSVSLAAGPRPDTATVSFTQYWCQVRSGFSYSSRGRVTLHLQWERDAWRVAAERFAGFERLKRAGCLRR